MSISLRKFQFTVAQLSLPPRSCHLKFEISTCRQPLWNSKPGKLKFGRVRSRNIATKISPHCPFESWNHSQFEIFLKKGEQSSNRIAILCLVYLEPSKHFKNQEITANIIQTSEFPPNNHKSLVFFSFFLRLKREKLWRIAVSLSAGRLPLSLPVLSPLSVIIIFGGVRIRIGRTIVMTRHASFIRLAPLLPSQKLLLPFFFCQNGAIPFFFRFRYWL